MPQVTATNDMETSSNRVRGLCFHPTSKPPLLLSALMDGGVEVWDVDSGQTISALPKVGVDERWREHCTH